MDTPREIILKQIREALSDVEETFGIPFKKDLYTTRHSSLLTLFQSAFTALHGKFTLCTGAADLNTQLLRRWLDNRWEHVFCDDPELQARYCLDDLPFISARNGLEADAVITGCEYLLARTGTILLTAARRPGRALSVYTPVHIVIATLQQLLPDIAEGIENIKNDYGDNLPSALFFTSGPSRTGDIEKTLVMGVHGPIEVHLFLCL